MRVKLMSYFERTAMNKHHATSGKQILKANTSKYVCVCLHVSGVHHTEKGLIYFIENFLSSLSFLIFVLQTRKGQAYYQVRDEITKRYDRPNSTEND